MNKINKLHDISIFTKTYIDITFLRNLKHIKCQNPIRHRIIILAKSQHQKNKNTG